MFWNKEKIEVYKEIPRGDATPLEALWISEDFSVNTDISNVFCAMLVRLYLKNIIKIKKKDSCVIEFNYDNVDMFSSNYKKVMEDYSLLKNVKPMFNEEIGFFYNELFKFTENSKILLEELKISLDELGFLNLLKVVAYENDGNITIKNLYKTLMKRDVETINDMGIETIIYFFSDLLPKVLFEKGYVSENHIKLFDATIQTNTEKCNEESKLWKGFKKYLKKDIYDDLENLSIKTFVEFCPYAIIFDCHEKLIETMLMASENSMSTDSIILDTIDSLNKEIQILDNMMFA